ncbi:MAG: alkaline phosphatase D family protein [Alphaproteobacteria bacterium]|nr:alkaline phosphatase D family protein [Alphaproteobacteria bacterium]
MPIDRREFLIGASAVAVACKTGDDADTDPGVQAAPTRDPGPPPYEAPGTEDLAVFPWSIAVGDPIPDGVRLSIRSTAATVEAVLARFSEGQWAEAGRLVGRDTDGWTHVVDVSGLDADAPYAVWAEVDGVRSRVTHFRTAPERGSLRQVRLLGTSCLGNASPELFNLAFMAEWDADALLLLGDTIYADGNVTLEDYRDAWDQHLRHPRCRDMFAACAVVATWDDHEVENNWILGEPPNNLYEQVTEAQVAAATEVWRDCVPMRPGPGGSGVWRRMRYGATVELFVLDCRGERAIGRMMSDTQLAWLVDALQGSEAHFKVVLTSIHATDHFELIGVIQDDDRWQGYPEERATLIAAAAAVPGTFFVTGDMHFGAVQRVDPEGGPGAGLFEVAVGPAGSTLFPVTDLAQIGGGELPAQYETLVETWSFSVMDFDPGLGTITVKFVGDTGEVIAEHTLEGI